MGHFPTFQHSSIPSPAIRGPLAPPRHSDSRYGRPGSDFRLKADGGAFYDVELAADLKSGPWSNPSSDAPATATNLIGTRSLPSTGLGGSASPALFASVPVGGVRPLTPARVRHSF